MLMYLAFLLFNLKYNIIIVEIKEEDAFYHRGLYYKIEK